MAFPTEQKRVGVALASLASPWNLIESLKEATTWKRINKSAGSKGKNHPVGWFARSSENILSVPFAARNGTARQEGTLFFPILPHNPLESIVRATTVAYWVCNDSNVPLEKFQSFFCPQSHMHCGRLNIFWWPSFFFGPRIFFLYVRVFDTHTHKKNQIWMYDCIPQPMECAPLPKKNRNFALFLSEICGTFLECLSALYL